ncbi:MAG: STAS domain-containing protein [Pseudomonadota bacterium]|nr:STAS domain-containing protein [Pseudomonadota bacterium]
MKRADSADGSSSPIVLEPQKEAVHVRGELTFATVPSAIEALVDVFPSASSELVLDLSKVSHSDSAGLALLIEWLRLARDRQVTLRFVGVPAQMTALAQVTRVDQLLAFN